MFRENDFDSNIVARFPVNYIYSNINLDRSDGIVPKLIHTSGSYSPGEDITGIQVKLISPSNNTLNLIVGNDSNEPLITTPILSQETIFLVSLIPVSMKLGTRGFVLPISTNLYISLDNLLGVGEYLNIQLCGVGY